VLVLAFDTATEVATSALVLDGRVLGERVGTARTLVGDVDDLLASAGSTPADLDALVVGASRARESDWRLRVASPWRSRSRAQPYPRWTPSRPRRQGPIR